MSSGYERHDSHEPHCIMARRRRFSKRRTFRKRRSNGLTGRVKRLERLARLRKPEVKTIIDDQVFVAMVQATGGMNGVKLMPALAQGLGSLARIGDRININSMEFSFTAYSNAAQPAAGPFRVIIVQQSSVPDVASVVPTLDDFLIDPTYVNSRYTPISIRRQFRIMFDKMGKIPIGNVVGFAGDLSLRNTTSFVRRLKIPRRIIQYVQASATILKSGEIYIFVISDPTLTIPSYKFTVKIRFTDA